MATFPSSLEITDGLTHEVKIAQDLSFPKGSLVVIDRGYVDYALFARWKKEGVWFVSRQKGNANYTVIEERRVPENRSKSSPSTFITPRSTILTPCAVSRYGMRQKRRALFSSPII